jgi:hypothetical protein
MNKILLYKDLYNELTFNKNNELINEYKTKIKNKNKNKNINIIDNIKNNENNENNENNKNNKNNDINEIDLIIPTVLKQKTLLLLLNNNSKILKYIKDDIMDVINNKKYLKYIEDNLTLMLEVFGIKKLHINDKINTMIRSSYNFCEKFPICYVYYNELIDTKYNNEKCSNDHLILNKLLKDIKYLIIYINNIGDENIINDKNH